jgi:hypothetical protein
VLPVPEWQGLHHLLVSRQEGRCKGTAAGMNLGSGREARGDSVAGMYIVWPPDITPPSSIASCAPNVC